MNSDGSTSSGNPCFNNGAVLDKNKLIGNYGLRNPGRIFINDAFN